MKLEINNCYNMDCADGMRLMKEQGIKADWCITDPPYGIEIEKMGFVKSGDKVIGKARRKDYTTTGDWDKQKIGGGTSTLSLIGVKIKLSLVAIITPMFYLLQKVGWFGISDCPQNPIETTLRTAKWRGVQKVLRE